MLAVMFRKKGSAPAFSCLGIDVWHTLQSCGFQSLEALVMDGDRVSHSISAWVHGQAEQRPKALLASLLACLLAPSLKVPLKLAVIFLRCATKVHICVHVMTSSSLLIKYYWRPQLLAHASLHVIWYVSDDLVVTSCAERLERLPHDDTQLYGSIWHCLSRALLRLEKKTSHHITSHNKLR